MVNESMDMRSGMHGGIPENDTLDVQYGEHGVIPEDDSAYYGTGLDVLGRSRRKPRPSHGRTVQLDPGLTPA
jgi:hypothetical protein